MSDRDPVAEAADDSRDLHDVATWENRTRFDRLAVAIHRVGVSLARAIVVTLALFVFLSQFILGGLGAVLVDPVVAALVALSAIPAFALALYVYRADVTMEDPLWLLVATFCLGILLATFAALVNSATRPYFSGLFLGTFVFFYLVVAPIEETVKLLAVRLYAYTSDQFDSVLDGAAFGAMAGLGFATIENALYISKSLASAEPTAAIAAAGGTAAVRALVGPGHVIYSAFAGYYLGLAKFNPENAGPIVVKGLLVAALIHGTYNTLVNVVPGILTGLLGITPVAALFLFILVYDGTFGYVLYRKLATYRATYREVTGEAESADGEEPTATAD